MKRFLSFIFLVIFWASLAHTASLTGPEETILRATEGRQVDPQIYDRKDVLPVEYMASGLSGQDLPPLLKRMRAALNTNARLQEDSTFGASKIDLSPLGPYDPILGRVYYVPYIPIPVKLFFEFNRGKNMSPGLQKFIFFKHNGVEFAKFFIHPSRTSRYSQLIEKYGIVRDEIPGFLAGSPRSFVVWDPRAPVVRPFVVKTSLHFKVNDDLKINIPNKLHRSQYVNSVMDSIPQSLRDKYKFDFLPESAQMMPREMQAATFYREFTSDYFQTNRIMVPGYYLSSMRTYGRSEALSEIISTSDKKPMDVATEVLRPLLRTAAYLMYEEGLKGELHEQNVDFEVELISKNSVGQRPQSTFEYNSENWGRLTGKIIVKDLDSFRVDSELRVRKEKTIAGLRDSFKPFVYTKFSRAAGWGDKEAPLFNQDAYDAYIVKTFGYSFSQVLSLTARDTEKLYRQLGQAMAEEVSQVIGREVSFPRGHAKQETWLDDIAREEKQKADQGVSRLRMDKVLFNSNLQNILREEYVRLRLIRRSTALLGALNSEKVYFILHRDVIEAREFDKDSQNDAAIGFAALESEQNPGQMQFEVRLKHLIPAEVMRSVKGLIHREGQGNQSFDCSSVFKGPSAT